MQTWKRTKLLFVILSLLCVSARTTADSIQWQETTIPWAKAGQAGLETLLVWPKTPGKHPVALISHGSPRDPEERAEMTAISFLPIAKEFARRGFAVAVVLRRGYGHSGGGWVERYGACLNPNYLKAAEASGEDLHTAITYLATLPQFDVSRMIAVGVSAGGLATIALTADSPPKGLITAISFAGGRGSTADERVCEEEKLISTFGELGKTSRVPMLWVYAENDHFFNPTLAEKFLKVFNAAGGHATLEIVPAFETEGHFLFSRKGIPTWTPILDDFLKKNNLILLDHPLPLPDLSNVAIPVQLSEKNKKDFLEYLSTAPHKAFAVSEDGSFGWRSGKYTLEEAKQAALDACAEYTDETCEVVAAE